MLDQFYSAPSKLEYLESTKLTDHSQIYFIAQFGVYYYRLWDLQFSYILE